MSHASHLRVKTFKWPVDSHIDITPAFHFSFVCVCRICHRHEVNTHNRWGAVSFLCTIFLSLSLFEFVAIFPIFISFLLLKQQHKGHLLHTMDRIHNVYKESHSGRIPLEPAFDNYFFLPATMKIFKRYVSILLSPSGIFPRYRKVEEKSNIMSKVSAINCPTSSQKGIMYEQDQTTSRITILASFSQRCLV